MSVSIKQQTAGLGVQAITNPLTGGVTISGGTKSYPINALAPYGRFIFIGDSLTQYGQPLRAPTMFDGRPYYLQASSSMANLGAAAWIPICTIDGAAPAGAVANLRTDASGKIQVAINADSYGPLVDISAGGWYYLTSGTLGYGILISVLGTYTPIASQTGTITAGGAPITWDHDLRGHAAWIAGALGDSFSDYQVYGIPGAKTQDVIQFLPQVFSTKAEAVYLLIGVNDGPTSAALAAAEIARIKTIINYCISNANRVFVGEIFPCPSATTGASGVQRFLSMVSKDILAYCRTKAGVIWVPNNNRLATFTTTAATGKTAIFNTDNLHLIAYGAYQASIDVVTAIKQAYPSQISPRKNGFDVWDSTLLTGAWNANPMLVGTAGTAGGGVTGTVPDGYNLARSGSTHQCTGSIDAAIDGGPSWYSMAVSGNATLGDYHMLTQTVAIPPGINAGGYFRISAEIMIGACTGAGLYMLTLLAQSNTNTNGTILLQLNPLAQLTNFSTELPVLSLQSEPQKLVAGASNFLMTLRIGAYTGGATGKISIRNWRIEKAYGPIYP